MPRASTVRPGLLCATAHSCRKEWTLTSALTLLVPVTPVLMPLKPLMPIQYINTLEIMHVCWVNEFNTGIITKWHSITQYHSGSTIYIAFSRVVLGFYNFCREKGRGKHSHFHRIALCHLGMQSRDAGPGGSHRKRVQLHEELPSCTHQKPGFEDHSPLLLLPGLFPGTPPPPLVSEHPMGEQDTCNQAFT